MPARRIIARLAPVLILAAGASTWAATLQTADGLAVTFSDADSSVTGIAVAERDLPLLSGQPGGLWVQAGRPLQPGPVQHLDFSAAEASWRSARNADWDSTGAYATWEAQGGVEGSPCLLLGNGTLTGVGMATAAPAFVNAGAALTISYSARVSNLETNQILCVRAYDSVGTDITGSTNKPVGWNYTSTSMAHALYGMACSAVGTWQRFEHTYRVPPGAAAVRVSLRHWTGGDHWLWIDNLAVDSSGGIGWSAPQRLSGPLTPVVGGFELSADLPGENIHAQVLARAQANALQFDFALEDTSVPLADRPIVAWFALPVALDGWQWWDDLADSRPIGADPLANTITLCGHAISQYPFAAVTGDGAGLSMGVPMDGPVAQRFEAGSAVGLRSVWDLCLTPVTTKFGAGRATASLSIAAIDPAWGFRAATRRYQGLHPGQFVKRTTREGCWLWPLHPRAIAEPDDFGFAYHESTPITSEADRASCVEHDVGIFYYSEPWNLWMNWGNAPVKPSYEERVGRLESWAIDGGSYAIWQAAGGPDGSAHLLIGDGAFTGVGVATQSLAIDPGTMVEIAWQARTADLQTLQIISARFFDAFGTDITASTAAPAGWWYSGTSRAFVISGLANTAADTWEGFSRTFKMPATATSLRVALRYWNGGDGFVHIDDVQVRGVGGMPVWLALPFDAPERPWSLADSTEWDATEPLWYRSPRRETAQIVQATAPLDAGGRYQLDYHGYLWQESTTGGTQGWVINPDPDLPSPNAYELFRENYFLLDLEQNDGVYLDSVTVTSGFGRWENRRLNHLAFSDTPLSFSNDDGGPAQLAPQAHAELYRALGAELHPAGKHLFGNVFPEAMRFCAHLNDVMGSETDKLVEADRLSRIRRTLAGTKVVTNLLQYNWDVPTYITTEEMERYIRGQLFWGFYPGVSSGGGMWVGGAPDRYFSHPDLYERDRPLFRRYIPVIRQLGAAGWEPVTAATGGASASIERFGDFTRGPVLLTVRATDWGPLETEVTLDLADCGLAPARPWSAADLLNGRSVQPVAEGPSARFGVALAAGEVGVYRFEAAPFVKPDFDRDEDVDQADFGHLQACFCGEGLEQARPECLNARLDGDADVDAADLDLFIACAASANIPPARSVQCQ